MTLTQSLFPKLPTLQLTIGWMLPHWVVRASLARAIYHATEGKYAQSDASAIRAVTVMNRWERSNEFEAFNE